MTMTTPTRRTARSSLDRLSHCSGHESGAASWWACVARHLDELGEDLAVSDNAGLVAQVMEDTPELAAGAVRLEHLDDAVRREVSELRLLIAARAGIGSAVAEVQRAIDEVMHRVRTLDRIADDLLLDAYERDYGGE